MQVLQRPVKMEIILTAAVVLLSCANLISSTPIRPYSKWSDYEDLPLTKPIEDTGSGDIVGTLSPLRPYEPWILECILFPNDKVEPGKRHARCQLLDESNEKEYARFLQHVQQWEETYPERAERWNERFPEAKANEKKKYEQLKAWADMHRKNESGTQDDSEDPLLEESASASTETAQRTDAPSKAAKEKETR